MKKIILLAVLAVCAGQCAFAVEEICEKPFFGKNKCRPIDPQSQEMTLGIVQREIKAGLTMDEVASALGSPNIVTKDVNGKDTWIYDKVSRVTSYGGSGSGGTIILAGYNKSKENYQTQQKTLTVVIKFDQFNKVETLNYHMSKF